MLVDETACDCGVCGIGRHGSETVTDFLAHLAERRGALNIVFAVVIIAVALYMLARNIFPSPA